MVLSSWMTEVIARLHPVRLMNADLARVAGPPTLRSSRPISVVSPQVQASTVRIYRRHLLLLLSL